MLRAAILIHCSEVRPLHTWILPIPPGALTKISRIPPLSILQATAMLWPLYPRGEISVQYGGLWWVTSQCKIVLITQEHGLQSINTRSTWSAIRCKLAFPDASQSHACSCWSSTSLLTLLLVLCRNVTFLCDWVYRGSSKSNSEGFFTTLIYDPSLVRQPMLTRGMCIPGILQHTRCSYLPQTSAEQREYYDGELILITPEIVFFSYSSIPCW
jgi:hypothetical protein